MSKVGQRAKEVLEAGLKLPSKDGGAYPDPACGGDAQMHRRVVGALLNTAECIGAVPEQTSVRGGTA